MSLTLRTNRPVPGSAVRVVNRGTEDAPPDRVRIETIGPVDLNGTEARMLASRLIRWSSRSGLSQTHGKNGIPALPVVDADPVDAELASFAYTACAFLEDWRAGRLTPQQVCDTLWAAAEARKIVRRKCDAIG